MGTPEFLERVPHCHIGQLKQQLILLHVSYAIYVSCSEAALLCCTIIRAPLQLTQEARNILQVNGNCLLSWRYDPPECFPTFVASYTKRILKSRLNLWRTVITSAHNLQPFVPLKLLSTVCTAFTQKQRAAWMEVPKRVPCCGVRPPYSNRNRKL